MRKNPWLAAVLNILIVGVGYIYIGKRVLFGVLMIITSLLSYIWYFTAPDAASLLQNIWIGSASIIAVVAFAVDAYKLAKEI